MYVSALLKTLCLLLIFRYKIQDTRFFISGKLPIVHDSNCLLRAISHFSTF